MEKITVDKQTLLITLRQNKEKHAALYQEALENFRLRCIDYFNAQIEAVSAGRRPETAWRLPIPEEHTEDYATIIAMLEWHQGDTWELADFEFRQYVEDNWQWKKNFITNTMSYTNTNG